VTNQSVGILGTGAYLPATEATNAEVAALVGCEAEWIERKTEILTRRYAAPTEAASDLAAKAAEQALEQAGIPAERLDYLILSTSTGDAPQPPTSNVVQHLIGASNAACFDVNVVCSGFVFALALARSLVSFRPGSHALVVATEVYSRILDFSDRRTAVLFADGAGAAVVGSVPEPYGIIDIELTSRGDASRLIRVEAGGSRLPASHDTVDHGGHYFRMDGRGVRDFVMGNVPAAVNGLLARVNATHQQIDHFVPHQGNGVMLRELVQAAGLSQAQTHRTVERYGNVGSASIPVTLDDANRSGALKDGDLVLLTGFGGGVSIGSSLIRWATPTG
jgi:3-oxoacyl-(acyl-carrier-protein) synthase III